MLPRQVFEEILPKTRKFPANSLLAGKMGLSEPGDAAN
jgi:hypothetical protein